MLLTLPFFCLFRKFCLQKFEEGGGGGVKSLVLKEVISNFSGARSVGLHYISYNKNETKLAYFTR
jgi:hypothetical protein